MKPIKYHRELMAELEALGATDVRVEHGGKHPKLYWTFGGRRYSHGIANTPSDSYRGHRNAISEMRRLSMRETA